MASVLVVDDNAANRLTLSALLETEGFDIAEASSLMEARQTLTMSQHFSVVLLDRQLGDGLGAELIPLIRSQMPHCKIIVVSGSDEGRKLDGGDEYFSKGGNLDALLEMIHKFCNGSAAPVRDNSYLR